MEPAISGTRKQGLKSVLVLTPLLLAVLFLGLAGLQTARAVSAPQVKLENCGAYYIGDPMAKDCPARNAAAQAAAAASQNQARSGLTAVWGLAIVVSLAAGALSYYFNSRWEMIVQAWGRR